MKKTQNVFCGALLFALMALAGCASSSYYSYDSEYAKSYADAYRELLAKAGGYAEPAAPAKSNVYKGAGITVAVLSPEFSSGTNDGWIPQSLQDNLTGLFAMYSDMSVLDRKNEAVAIAEQTLSETGFYSEANAAQIGRMTNAQYITVGSVRKTSGTYECNFRINEVETNEIKAAAAGRYSLSALENGTAVKEIAHNLLSGLSIEFSDAELKTLMQKNDAEVRSVTMLAKGDAANKAEKYIEALSFYNQVGGSHKSEATQSSRAMLAGLFDTSSLKDRIQYQQRQVEKWNKIFRELETYMDEHTPIIVYDFSELKDDINMGNKTVNITVTPGIKVFPDRNALSVWKTVIDEWIAVRSNEDNKGWAGTVRGPLFGFSNSSSNYYNLNYEYDITIGLYNEDEELLEKKNISYMSGSPSISWRVYDPYAAYDRQFSSPELKSQKTYFAEAKTHKVYFRVPLSRVSSSLTVKIVGDVKTRVNTGNYKNVTAVYSAAEWQRMNK